MIWQQLAWYFVTTLIVYALTPKPKGPRPASIDDFQLPTAEEGRPIPVLFGEMDISGPNVLWYGDLGVRSKKEGGLFGSTTTGFQYSLGIHMGLCHGPVDAVTAVIWGDKLAWSGNITSNATGAIDQRDLFGGDKREGGIAGKFDIEMGGSGQTVNAYLASQLAAPVPAYRGILGFVWKGDSTEDPGFPGYIGTTPYVKPIAIRCRRILQGWNGGAAWYSSKANIANGMNPAHVIYQVLTDPEWGMGIATTQIDTASFEAAADDLFDEGFGLYLLWNQQATVEDFLQIVMNHVAGAVSLNNATGKYELVLMRGNYDPNTLPQYNESNVTQLVDYQRQAWAETVNEVTLVYTDPETRKDTSITQQDLANIDAQAVRVPEVVELRGIRNHEVAKSVLARELAARSTPLSKITMEVNRTAWNTHFGGVFRLSWAERGLTNVVYRVLKINKGTLSENTIRIEAVEDIYALDTLSYLAPNPNPPDTPTPPLPPQTPQGGPSVISNNQSSPPLSPNPQDGDRYFIPLSPPPTGAWAGHGGQIAEWDAENQEWIFIDVPDGTIIYNQGTGSHFQVVNGQIVDAPWITALADDLTPPQITGNQNNYAPTGLSTSNRLRLTSDASHNITGLSSSGVTDGKLYALMNVGTNDIVLVNNSSSSTSANRFRLAANITISSGMSVLLTWDGAGSPQGWRAVATYTATGGAGGQASIQFKDEGVNVGSLGAITSLDVVGTGATLTAVGTAATLTVPGAAFGSGAGVLQFVAEDVLVSTGDTLTVSGLDLDAHAEYILELALKNTSASPVTFDLYFNGDTTTTNYDRETATWDGSSASASRANTALAGGLLANGVGNFTTIQGVRRDVDGHPRYAMLRNSESTTSILGQLYMNMWRTSANVTSISIVGSSANCFAANSYMRVYRPLLVGEEISGDVTPTWALDIAPTQITSNQNNYAPTGLSTANRLRLTSDASRNITGISSSSWSDGKSLALTNIGAHNIVLKANDANSSSANRFRIASDITLSSGHSALIIWDGAGSPQGWRALGVYAPVGGSVSTGGYPIQLGYSRI